MLDNADEKHEDVVHDGSKDTREEGNTESTLMEQVSFYFSLCQTFLVDI